MPKQKLVWMGPHRRAQDAGRFCVCLRFVQCYYQSLIKNPAKHRILVQGHRACLCCIELCFFIAMKIVKTIGPTHVKIYPIGCDVWCTLWKKYIMAMGPNKKQKRVFYVSCIIGCLFMLIICMRCLVCKWCSFACIIRCPIAAHNLL